MSSKVLRSTWHALNRNAYSKPEPKLVRFVTQQSNESKKQESTIDQSEVQLFSQMKDWWNPNGPMKPLHSMNMIRVPFVRDGLLEGPEIKTLTPLKDKKILDVGCGGGILAEALARLGANVTGIDATKELIKIAIEHRDIDPKIAHNKPEYHLISVEEHVKSFTNHYDGVVASEVIEHVNNKEVFVKSCIQALKPGGKIFFTTPNRTPVSRFASICVAEYVLNLLPRGTHQYEKFITPNELTFLLERMTQEYLRYISVKPTASISALRQKVWHLLDLPDYCEEVIILKSPGDVEIPLTELRRGNDPQHPYFLEVWLPEKKSDSSTTFLGNMITMGQANKSVSLTNTVSLDKCPGNCGLNRAPSTISNETIETNNCCPCPSTPYTLHHRDFQKSDLSCRMSTSSMFRLNGKRSKDNFTVLLLKIQNDLSTLSQKLTILENKIPTSG